MDAIVRGHWCLDGKLDNLYQQANQFMSRRVPFVVNPMICPEGVSSSLLNGRVFQRPRDKAWFRWPRDALVFAWSASHEWQGLLACFWFRRHPDRMHYVFTQPHLLYSSISGAHHMKMSRRFGQFAMDMFSGTNVEIRSTGQ